VWGVVLSVIVCSVWKGWCEVFVGSFSLSACNVMDVKGLV